MHNRVQERTTYREGSFYMPTAEEVLRARAKQVVITTNASREDAKAQRLIYHNLAVVHFSDAVHSATARLKTAGFPGGKLKQQWLGGMITSEVAVWYLPTSLIGSYWLAPSLREVLNNPVRGDAAIRHHANDITNRNLHPEYHNAVYKGWLLGMPSDPLTEDLENLTIALDGLLAKAQ